MGTISDLLESALVSATQTGAADVSERCARLRTALDVYERVALQRAERQAVEKMFAAISMPLPEAPLSSEEDLRNAEIELKSAMGDMLPEGGPPVSSVTSIAPPAEEIDQVLEQAAEVASPPVILTSAGPRVIGQTASTEDLATAAKLLSEFKELDASYQSLPTMRLQHLLQAIAAEGRFLLERLPARTQEYQDIVAALRRILVIKNSCGVTTFISGLSRSAQGNWQRIATISRRQLELLDEPKKKSKGKPPKSAAEPAFKREPPGIPFPKLAALSTGTPLMLIGGLKVPEKIDYLKGMGINAEWFEIEKGSPRIAQQVGSRILNNKAPAAIIMEYFMAHSTLEILKTACNQVRMIFATADKGGQSALYLALNTLEFRLNVAN